MDSFVVSGLKIHLDSYKIFISVVSGKQILR